MAGSLSSTTQVLRSVLYLVKIRSSSLSYQPSEGCPTARDEMGGMGGKGMGQFVGS